jgi:hypothetical protein
MKLNHLILVACSAAVYIMTALGASSHKAGRTPVLVELFTSEGCSSCPPADEMLARLGRSQSFVANADIIALSEHVDYWNHLGWADPYSSPQFSARQQEYGRSLSAETVYTPQMVVNGQAEFNGSDINRARSEIQRAASLPGATVEITPMPEGTGAYKLTVRVEDSSRTSRGAADIMLAITEDNLSSNVARGENSGRRLNHAAVVRTLTKIGTVDFRKSEAFSGQATVQPAQGWNPQNLRAVVFVQEHNSRRVIGAGAVPLQ